MTRTFDLGYDHLLRFTSWAPDRKLNPQYDGLPDVERIGVIVSHLRADGTVCEGSLLFDSDVARRVFPDQERWTVVSFDPLTLDPSIKCSCGDRGHIRDGCWIPA